MLECAQPSALIPCEREPFEGPRHQCGGQTTTQKDKSTRDLHARNTHPLRTRAVRRRAELVRRPHPTYVKMQGRLRDLHAQNAGPLRTRAVRGLLAPTAAGIRTRKRRTHAEPS